MDNTGNKPFSIADPVKYDGRKWVVDSIFKKNDSYFCDLISIEDNPESNQYAVNAQLLSIITQDQTKPHVWVINMDTEVARFADFYRIFSKYFCIFRQVPLPMKTVQLSLSITYLKILTDRLLSSSYSSSFCLIMEDDCRPIAPNGMDEWMERWLSIKAQLDEYPNEWNYFSGGILKHGESTTESETKVKKVLLKKDNYTLVRYTCGWCTHFSYFNIGKLHEMSLYRPSFDIGDYPKEHIDNWLYKLDGIKPVLALPFLAEQSPNISSTHLEYRDYRKWQSETEALLMAEIQKK